MRQISFKITTIKYLIGVFALGFLISAGTLNSQAQSTTTFAQFFEDDGSQDYSFTNNTTNATFNTVGGGSNIFFIYQNITGLNAALQGPQQAILTLTTTTTTPAALSNGGLDQPLNQTITLTITRATAAPPGVGNGLRTNLLTAVINTSSASPLLTGGNNGGSASFSATTPNQTVTFTSDFISFVNTNQRNVGLSFSSVQPSFTLGAGNFLSNFTAAATGTFASNPVPIVTPPNTAAAVSISGRVLTPAGRGLRNAYVTLTRSDGFTRTVLTRTNGEFNFSEVEIPQIVTLTVTSRNYRYDPRVLSLEANFADLDFVPIDTK